jgi:hypothetical protein
MATPDGDTRARPGRRRRPTRTGSRRGQPLHTNRREPNHGLCAGPGGIDRIASNPGGTVTTTGYIRLSQPVREQTLAAARQQAQRAAARYADLLAAEAGIAARAVLPTVAQLMFRRTSDVLGPSASLVAGYGRTGRQQWHVDLDGEWPDESLVTDHLAAAAHWCGDAFDHIDADGEELYILNIDD